MAPATHKSHSGDTLRTLDLITLPFCHSAKSGKGPHMFSLDSIMVTKKRCATCHVKVADAIPYVEAECNMTKKNAK